MTRRNYPHALLLPERVPDVKRSSIVRAERREKRRKQRTFAAAWERFRFAR